MLTDSELRPIIAALRPDDRTHLFEELPGQAIQRLFNLRMGYGTRIHDYPPYRAVGPVTAKEYESRAERYDKQLREELGIDPEKMNTAQKMNALRRHREERYEMLVDAVYKRRGWTKNGVPTLETARRLGIDFPDVVELIQKNS